MIYIVVAMHTEALPLIRHYKMKKLVAGSRPFQIFVGGPARLVITGVGGVKACSGVNHILTAYPPEAGDFLLNVGVAGSDVLEVGSPALCNRIVNTYNGREFFPEMLWQHPFSEGSVGTYPFCVNRTDAVPYDMADMEIGFIYESALLYMPAHRIQALKIVSDRYNPELLTKKAVEKYIEAAVPALTDWIEGISAFARVMDGDILTAEEQSLIGNLAARLRLTYSMALELTKTCRRYKLRHGELSVPGMFQAASCSNKSERKKIYGELIQLLME